MKSYKIHLIRNALTQENLDGRYLGHTDSPICEQGKAQLAELVENYKYPSAQVVFSSPLKRCMDTARAIYPDKEIIPLESLIEYNFGEFDGKTAEELEKHTLFPRWLAGEEGVDPPFGESNADFAKRICEGFEGVIDGMLKSGVESVAIVTHGGIIGALMARYAIPEASSHEWLTPSSCGYTLRITPSLWMTGQKAEAVCEIPEEEHDFDHERALWGQAPYDEKDLDKYFEGLLDELYSGEDIDDDEF